MIMCQVSLYPRGVTNGEGIIDEVAERLKYHGVEYERSSFSINVYGREDDVWLAIQDLFQSVRQVCGNSMLQAVFVEKDQIHEVVT